MQGLLGFPNNHIHFHKCRVSDGIYAPHILPQEAESVTRSCYNPVRLNIITCLDDYKKEFLDEVGGLSLNIPLSSSVVNLPSYIPILDYGARDVILPPTIETVGLTLSDVVAQGVKLKAGMYQEQRAIRLKMNLLQNLGFNSRNVILFNTGTDTLLEWLWYNRETCAFLDSLRQMGFSAATGFNFSVIGGECAFAQALNIKRSLYSAHLIEQSGVCSIPHLYAVNNYQVYRWIKWFQNNPSVKCFVINCQLQKSRNDIDMVIGIVKQILTQIPRLHVILQGFPIKLIRLFTGLLSQIHIADKGAFKHAQSKVRVEFDVKKATLKKTNDLRASIQELAVFNTQSRQFFLEYLLGENV